MKNYRRILAFAAAAVMIFGTNAAPIAQTFTAPMLTASALEYTEGTYGDFSYRNYDSFIAITGIAEIPSTPDIVIPAEIDGVKVTHIEDKAFYENMMIRSVSLPSSVYHIGAHAFYRCTSLQKINLPKNLTYLGEYAFMSCTSLNSIVIPGMVDVIPEGCFLSCVDLKGVVIERTMTGTSNASVIGKSAFENCADLESVSIPTRVATIAENAFSGTGVKTVHYDGNLTGWRGIEIGEGNSPLHSAELKFTEITQGTIDGLDYQSFGSYVQITGADKSLTSVEIPSIIDGVPVREIGTDAFRDCTNLQSVTLPVTIDTIEAGAFRGCTALTAIDIPATVEQMGSGVFAGCKALTDATIGIGVTRIPSSTFSGCESLVNVNLPETVDDIDMYSFAGCTSLKSIDLPDRVRSIGFSAFEGCTALESIELPEDLWVVNGDAFAGCDSLTSVTIPSGVEHLDNNAFSGANFTDIHVDELNNVFKSIDGVLFKKDGTVLHSYPRGRTGAYTVPEGALVIDTRAFRDCTGLTGITLAESTATIMDNAFENCTGLETLHIPAKLMSIRGGAFTGCSSLTEISISEENQTFRAEDNMIIETAQDTLVFVPSTVGGTVTIPESIKRIGFGAFENNTAITEVVLHDGVEFVYNRAFANCTNLAQVTLQSVPFTLLNGAFSGCTALTSITIPEGITSVADYTFSGCTNLTEVSLPASLTHIGFGAFDGSALTTIHYNGREDMWNNIDIRDDNEEIANAEIICNNDSTATPPPTQDAYLGDLDTNGDVNASDAAVILEAAATAGANKGGTGLSVSKETAADVNQDGMIDATDAAIVLQYAAYTGTGGTDSLAEYIASRNQG